MIANRKNDIDLQVAACQSYQDVHYVDNHATGGIYEFMSDGFKQQWHRDIDVAQLEVVPCMPLSSVLKKFEVRLIDFWSLDVEGAEFQVRHDCCLLNTTSGTNAQASRECVRNCMCRCYKRSISTASG